MYRSLLAQSGAHLGEAEAGEGLRGEGESRGRTQGSFRTLLAWRLGGIVLLMRKADAKAGKLSELFLGTQVRGLPETGGDEARQITDASCLSHECL